VCREKFCTLLGETREKKNKKKPSNVPHQSSRRLLPTDAIVGKKKKPVSVGIKGTIRGKNWTGTGAISESKKEREISEQALMGGGERNRGGL